MNKEDNNLFGIDKLNIKRSSIPAVTHVDYSARIQTVHEETNPKYYQLIKEFKKITNCPVLVNTSFNVRGEPIVCSVEDAFNCFMATNLDILVIENFILFKNDQDKSLVKDYKNKFELD
jgi:carbamoyltransferase